MALNGLVLATVIVDEDDRPLGDAWVELMGLAETGRSGKPLVDEIEAELGQFLDKVDDRTIADDDKFDEAIRRIVRQVCVEEIGKKPEVSVVISRLAAE
jgi:ribonuclease J